MKLYNPNTRKRSEVKEYSLTLRRNSSRAVAPNMIYVPVVCKIIKNGSGTTIKKKSVINALTEIKFLAHEPLFGVDLVTT